MTNYLDKIHKGRDEIHEIVDYIKYLGRAFRDVGNNKVAEDLWEMSNNIELAVDSIVDAVNDDINDYLSQNQEQFEKTIMAALDTNQSKGE